MRSLDVASIVLPRGCTVVGVELVDDAIELPSFRHPRQAAYVFGPERGSLSPAMVEKCEFLIRIPTQFSVNVGIAGAIVMYDRILNLGHYPNRPMRPGGPIDPNSRARVRRPGHPPQDGGVSPRSAGHRSKRTERLNTLSCPWLGAGQSGHPSAARMSPTWTPAVLYMGR